MFNYSYSFIYVILTALSMVSIYDAAHVISLLSVLLLFQESFNFRTITIYPVLLGIIIAFISIILPIFFSMKGVLTIGPEKNALICGLIPATTYVAQSIFFRYFDAVILLLNLITGFFIALPHIKRLIERNLYTD